jgi:hypothetical protein
VSLPTCIIVLPGSQVPVAGIHEQSKTTHSHTHQSIKSGSQSDRNEARSESLAWLAGMAEMTTQLTQDVSTVPTFVGSGTKRSGVSASVNVTDVSAGAELRRIDDATTVAAASSSKNATHNSADFLAVPLLLLLLLVLLLAYCICAPQGMSASAPAPRRCIAAESGRSGCCCSGDQVHAQPRQQWST